MRYSSKDISQLGTIVGIWAHPDDETWSAAGIMATAAQNGQKVACITATHGDAGKTADQLCWQQDALYDIRAHASQTGQMFADPEMRAFIKQTTQSEHFVRLI